MSYYTEIESYIKRNEVNKRVRVLEENYDTLLNYWNIGRLLVEAQGGEKRAKYGDNLIKEWSVQFTEKYGSGYNRANLFKMRKFFLLFSNVSTSWRQLTWSHIRELLSMKDENKRNYYINLCITRNLSVRDLVKEIKGNAYERLVDKSEKIEIIQIKKTTILENMKNPILLELNMKEEPKNEKELEMLIIAQLKIFFKQLGEGFTFVDNQYKMTINNQNYFIDILLFNINFNCYVVVELKSRELRKEDKAQIEFYMEYIDTQVKKEFHNRTIGIIVSKEQNKLIANFVGSESIIPLTYKIED